MMVVIAKDGKTFHAAACAFIHDKTHPHVISSAEAMREGYVPCVRCMRRYLNTSASVLPVTDSDHSSAGTP